MESNIDSPPSNDSPLSQPSVLVSGTPARVQEPTTTLPAAIPHAEEHTEEPSAMRWDQAPTALRAWIEAHPYQTAFLVMNGVIVLAPGVLSAPVLAALGWGGAGVRAGSFAAGLQSTIGNVGARSAFAYVQSAAMGGYGAGAVASVVRVGALIAGGLGGRGRGNGELIKGRRDCEDT
ncbi:hypothetical protein B7494_g5308 [Chlorociboria aeruginascens]|nr:hypothetical protein B7494_g5308 [Chlorociboria aeruginascens]